MGTVRRTDGCKYSSSLFFFFCRCVCGLGQYQRTRLERWTHALTVFYREFTTALFSTKAKQKIVDIASESSKSSEKDDEDEEDEDDKLPHYPAWMWESIGMQNPYTAEGWIDPHALGKQPGV